MQKLPDPPLFICLPDSQDGKAQLARQAAAVHADWVIRYLQQLSCPEAQKKELIQALIREKKADLP